MSKFIKSYPIWLSLALLALQLGGCSKSSPYTPVLKQAQRASVTLSYDAGLSGYQETLLEMNKDFKFLVREGSVIPPESLQNADEIDITMLVEENEDKGELIFTFGPEGMVFSEPAEIILSYRALSDSIDDVVFYYIDKDGTYIKQEPARIDEENRSVMLRVHHFSRYAVAHAH